MREDIERLWRNREVHGLELLVATVLLALRYLSISYWLRRVLPEPGHSRRPFRDNVVDAYSVLQLIALLVLLANPFGRIVNAAVAAYIVFEIYLVMLNIIFIGKFRDINSPPASVERSILLLGLNVAQVVLAFGIAYRDWLGYSTIDGIFRAVLVLGTIGYPDNASGNFVLLVALQILLDLILLVLLISSFVSQIALFGRNKST